MAKNKGVTIKGSSGKIYNYISKKNETIIIDGKIKEDISKFCKSRKINKSKLIEEFYKTILIRFKDGSLSASNGYVTMNILRKPIVKY